MIVQAVIKMGKQSIRDWMGILLSLLAFVIVAFASFSPVYVIAFSAAVGLLVTRGKEVVKE